VDRQVASLIVSSTRPPVKVRGFKFSCKNGFFGCSVSRMDETMRVAATWFPGELFSLEQNPRSTLNLPNEKTVFQKTAIHEHKEARLGSMQLLFRRSFEILKQKNTILTKKTLV
jgi:hypothetical protein